METLQWTEKISVNNEKIDDQHKKLIDLTNELILHSNAAPNSQIVNETLYELLKYTKYHFQDEEELMEKFNYPKLDEHKKKHREFVRQIAMFCEDVIEGKATVTNEILKFLTEWITQHTSIEDMDYKNYI